MAFPLQTVTTAELKELCQALWDWELCGECQATEGTTIRTRRCREAHCLWGQRSERLGPFFNFYREATCSYVPDFFGDDEQALRSHRDLFEIIRIIRKYGYTLPRRLCVRECFASRDVNRQSLVPETDQDRAFDLAARVLTMTNICADSRDIVLQGNKDEEGMGSSAPAIWPSTKCLQDSMIDLFSSRIHPSLQPGDPQEAHIKTSLTADNLRKIARLRIEGTDNLLDHLKLDASGSVQVFHHTTFLKEHLLATKARESDGPEKSSLSPPCLPRELALETLYTLQLLFPPGGKSQATLRNLVSKQGFDPDCLRFGTALFEFPHEKKRALCFPVWGTRLMDLYDEIENPKPRSTLDAWLERRSKSRHIMLVTMIGVLVAVLLGVLGLCVSIFQTWIAWQEWKSPK
ncbi:RanBP2-type domain-containing protein [Madurella fahalii]|uniref:RanBP2-type domain-containing protein n=1 Tax=Madurella fahalii TaxID=1157608 RepID=A0ABQ0GGQ8_9PEZI